MRGLTALLLASSLIASSAIAAPTDAALSSGKPAGVKEAQLAGNGLLLVFGIAVVAGGIALVSSQGSGNNITNTTTATGTGTP